MALRCIAVLDSADGGPERAWRGIFVRRFPTVERSWARAHGPCASGTPEADEELIAALGASVPAAGDAAPPVVAAPLGAGRGELWPVLVLPMRAGPGREVRLAACPLAKPTERRSPLFELPCVTATLQFMRDLEPLVVECLALATPAARSRRLAWTLANAAPFGTPRESSHWVVETAFARSNRLHFAEHADVRHPAWRPSPANDGIAVEATRVVALGAPRLLAPESKLRDGALRWGLPESPASGPVTPVPSGALLALNVVEVVSAAVADAEGALATGQGWQIAGRIECCSRLEGTQEVQLRLDGLDRIVDWNLELAEERQVQVRFFRHGCVTEAADPVPTGGLISFRPPLGTFVLCTYVVSVPPDVRLDAARPARASLTRACAEDGESISSRGTALTAKLSHEDRGRLSARHLRSAARAGLASVTQTLPNLPFRGSLSVRRPDLVAPQGSAWQMSLALVCCAYVEAQERQHAQVRVHVVGNAALQNDLSGLRVTVGKLAYEPATSSLCWDVPLAALHCLGPSGARVDGVLVVRPNPQCDAAPGEPTTFEGDDVARVVAAALPEEPRLEALIHCVVAGHSASGLGIRATQVRDRSEALTERTVSVTRRTETGRFALSEQRAQAAAAGIDDNGLEVNMIC